MIAMTNSTTTMKTTTVDLRRFFTEDDDFEAGAADEVYYGGIEKDSVVRRWRIRQFRDGRDGDGPCSLFQMRLHEGFSWPHFLQPLLT